jgi:hypothetical protein
MRNAGAVRCLAISTDAEKTERPGLAADSAERKGADAAASSSETAARRSAYTPQATNPIGAMGIKRPRDRRKDGPDRYGGPCPFCRAGFLQRNSTAFENAPGWVCDNPACGYRVLATDLIRASKAHLANANRRVVKARAIADRANCRVAANHDRLKNRTKRSR